MLSGSYQSPNNESNSRSVLSFTRGISVTNGVTIFLSVFVLGPHRWSYTISVLDDISNYKDPHARDGRSVSLNSH